MEHINEAILMVKARRRLLDHLLRANWIGSVNTCQLKCRALSVREGKVSDLSRATCVAPRDNLNIAERYRSRETI